MNDIWDFIDEDMKDHFEKKIKTYTVQRTKATEEELEKAIRKAKKEFKTQYKEQLLKDAINYREFYRDKTGAFWILVKIPNSKPRTYNKKDGSVGTLYFVYCALIEADITLFYNEDDFPLQEDTVYLLRGGANPQYRNIDSKEKNDFCSETEYCKQKGVENLEDLDPYEYERRFSFNLWTIIQKGR